MLRNKKKFIALAIFLIMSFVMFASANPSGESSLLPDDNKPIVNPDNKTDETDQGDTNDNENTNNNEGTGNVVRPIVPVTPDGGDNNQGENTPDGNNKPEVIDPVVDKLEYEPMEMEINESIPDFLVRIFGLDDNELTGLQLLTNTDDINNKKVGEYKIIFTVNGKTFEKMFKVVDTTNPVISNLVVSSETLTKEDVTATWEIVETGSGIKTVQRSADGITWYDLDEAEFRKLVFDKDTNEKVYIKAIDEAGNESNVIEFNVNIDKTPAKITLRYVSYKPEDDIKGDKFNYINLGKRVAVRFWTDEEIDTTNSVITIAGQKAKITRNTSELSAIEYVAEINVDDTAPEGIVEFILNIVDLVGNGTEELVTETAPLSNNGRLFIDKTAPVVEKVTYSPKKPTNGDVIVTIIFSEEVKGVDGWTKDTSNPKVWTKTYTENSGEVVKYEDLAGNKGVDQNINVTNIDKTAPEGEFSYSNNNGNSYTFFNVVVTLKTNEPIITPKGWTRLNDKTFVKVVSKNGTSTVKIEDLAGNTNILEYTVQKIDKAKPTITVVDPLGNESNKLFRKISFKFNDDNELDSYFINLKKFNIDGNKSEFDLDYEDVKNNLNQGINLITVIDKAGNAQLYTFTFDSVLPNGTFTYSNNGNITNQDVIVTLKPTELIKTLDGWTKVNNRTYRKSESENGTYTVTIEDLAGNTNALEYTVSGIDKVAPIIEATEPKILSGIETIDVRIIDENIDLTKDITNEDKNLTLEKLIPSNSFSFDASFPTSDADELISTNDEEVILPEVTGEESQSSVIDEEIEPVKEELYIEPKQELEVLPEEVTE